MPRLAIPLLLLLLLGATGFGIAQLSNVHALQASLADREQQSATLKKRINALEKQNSDLAARLDRGSRGPARETADAGPVAEDGPPVAGNGPGGRTRGGPGGPGGRFAEIMNNPEIQKLMALQQKASLDGRYAALFKQLNLNPADLEKFKNMLVEKQSALADVMAAARTEGLNPRTNRDEIQQLVQSAQNEVDANIRATLGDSAFNQYKDFETTQPQRAVVSQLDQRLSYSSTPLSDSQSAQLVSILAATSPSDASANGNGGGIRSLVTASFGGVSVLGGNNTKITDAAITQAQGVLSAPQVAALQSLQQEQQAAAALSQQMRATFGGRGPNTGPSAAPTATPAPASSAPPKP